MSTISCYLTQRKLNFIFYVMVNIPKDIIPPEYRAHSPHTRLFSFFFAMPCMSKITSTSKVPTTTSQQPVYMPDSHQNTTKNNRQESKHPRCKEAFYLIIIPSFRELQDLTCLYQNLLAFFSPATAVQYLI